MKITDIKQQAKHKDRVSIYIDSKYSFSLSVWQLGQEKLHVGDLIDATKIAEYQDKSATGKLYDRALSWLAIRPRSEWEIREYLNRKSKDSQHVEAVYARLAEKGYVDDQDFAARWINSRRLYKPMSKYRIKQELYKKRVPKEIIETSMEDDRTDDIETLKQLIVKKQARYKDRQKLMSYLFRQGYNYGDIKQAISELEEQKAI